MAKRSVYNTQHRQEILAVLAEQKRHLSARELADLLDARGLKLSVATLYRQLEHLVEEGVLLRSTPVGERKAYFELQDHAHCEHACYHLKCEGCGELIHLNCNDFDALTQHLLSSHGFKLDLRQSVMFGLCEHCQELEKDQKERA